MSEQVKTVIHDDELGKVAVITERTGAEKFSVSMYDVDNNHKLLSKTEKEGSQAEFHESLRASKEHYLEESDKL
jgi:hypothetical protein